jgi:hypothetical protein
MVTSEVRSEDISTEMVPARFFFLLLLIVVLAAALEFPEWLILVGDLPVPWLDKNLPYLAPFVVAILLFNILLAVRTPPGRVSVSLEALLLILFVVAVWGIELAHLATGGGEFHSWLHLGYFWLVLFFLTVLSFQHRLPDCREQVVRTVAALSVAMALLLGLAQAVSPSWGTALSGLVASQLFDSAQVAYTALLGLAVLLFDYRPRSHGEGLLAYGLGCGILVWVVTGQRLAGPILLLLLLLGLRAFCFLRGRKQRIAFAILLIACLAAGLLLLSNVRDPTLSGLSGGSVYYDEVGAIHGDIASSYARRETIYASLRIFLDAPLFGAGMASASELRSLTFGLHSNIFYLLASAGLAGFSLFILPLALATRRAFRNGGLRAFAYPGLVLGTMLLMPKVAWWWAVAIYLLITLPPVFNGRTKAI